MDSERLNYLLSRTVLIIAGKRNAESLLQVSCSRAASMRSHMPLRTKISKFLRLAHLFHKLALLPSRHPHLFTLLTKFFGKLAHILSIFAGFLFMPTCPFLELSHVLSIDARFSLVAEHLQHHAASIHGTAAYPLRCAEVLRPACAFLRRVLVRFQRIPVALPRFAADLRRPCGLVPPGSLSFQKREGDS